MNLQGLNKQQVEESRQKHGANTLTQIPPEPLWKKILEGFKDPMIMILLVALVIQVVLCFMGEAHWYEPVGILIAIMIANGVSAISESYNLPLLIWRLWWYDEVKGRVIGGTANETAAGTADGGDDGAVQHDRVCG